VKKIIGTLLIAGLPGISHADASVDELKAELHVLQQKVENLEKSAASAASSRPQSSEPAVSPAEFASLKQQVAKQDLQVETLSTAASEGPIAGLSITGYLDPVYLYNRNARSGGFSFLDHNSPYTYYNGNMGDVYLDIKKTFGVGPLAPSAEIQIQPNRGAGNTTLDGAKGNNIFNTAFITIPHDDANQFVAGLMPSLAGYESQQSTLVPTLTHNLLYDFSIPGYFVGIGYNGSKGEYTWKVILGNEQNQTHATVASDSSGRLHTNVTPMINWRIDRSKGAWDWVGPAQSAVRRFTPATRPEIARQEDSDTTVRAVRRFQPTCLRTSTRLMRLPIPPLTLSSTSATRNMPRGTVAMRHGGDSHSCTPKNGGCPPLA
jgi:Protein of unknown function (DUF3138).